MRWIMRGDTEIDGLYMAGQDAWTPAVAGAMYGGLLGSLKVNLSSTFKKLCLSSLKIRMQILNRNCIDFKKLSVLAEITCFMYSCAKFKFSSAQF